MRGVNFLLARLSALVKRETVIRDIDEEFRVHVDMETSANLARGMSAAEAREAARSGALAIWAASEIQHTR